VTFRAEAELRGHDDQPADLATFLAGLRADDDLRVQGTLDDSGGLHAHGASHRRHGDDGPHRLGRIVELLPTDSFRMVVLVEVRDHGRFLPTGQTTIILVHAASARVHDGRTALTFAALHTDDLVEVEGPLGPDGSVVAREVELEREGAQAPVPEVQGNVAAVDPVARTLLLTRHGDDPLFAGGQPVAQLQVRFTERTVLVRRTAGGERLPIRLEQVMPGQDRAWVHGILIAPDTIEAIDVRVRDDAH
jgi:hypothetical protein